MNRRSLLKTLPAALGAHAAAPRRRPNIVLVMMDDFGVGQFAPLAAALEPRQFDPALLDFLRRHKAAYTPEQALDFARRAMPEMTRLAGGGAVFANACAPSNLCAPSRTGVLMGRLQNRYGMYQNIDVEAYGVEPGKALAAQLQKAGYATGFVGKWHAGPRDDSLRQPVLKKHGLTLPQLNRLPQRQRAAIEREIAATGYIGSCVEPRHPLNNGFDYYFGYNTWQCPFYNSEQIWENRSFTGVQERYNTELFTEKAIEFIRGAASRGRPFFVQVSYHAMHAPLKPQAPDKYFRRFPSNTYSLSNFYAHVNAVDEGVAAIRAAIGREWENTLFFFCADNGAPAGLANTLPGNAPYAGHKGGFLQGGFRVPMLAHWPAGFGGGRRRSELVSTLDIMPTALDAAGVALPADLDGRSLLPLLRGGAAKVHDHLVLAGIHARSWGFMGETVIGANPERRREQSPGAWVVIDGRYLLRFVTSTPAGLFREAPDGAPARYEMFDLREDPAETRNIYGQLPQVAAELKQVFARQARSWPPPRRWREDRWREMKP